MLPIRDSRDGLSNFGTFGDGVAIAVLRVKILLDECVPWPMHKIFVGHECTAVKECGWGGIKNGELLQLAEGNFDVFITADQNIRYQQNLAGRRIPIIELSTNNLRRVLASSALLHSAVATIKPGEFRQLDIP